MCNIYILNATRSGRKMLSYARTENMKQIALERVINFKLLDAGMAVNGEAV